MPTPWRPPISAQRSISSTSPKRSPSSETGQPSSKPISIVSGSVQQVRVRFSLGAADPVNFGANRPGFQMGIPAGAETVVRNIATVPGVPGAASGNIHGNQHMILPPVVAVFVTTAGDPLVNVVWELWATMTLEFLP